MIGDDIKNAVEREIIDYSNSLLRRLTDVAGAYAIKFVASKWASAYATSASLKISEHPALTWGTATYVTPLAFPLSSAVYGRIGLVTTFDPTGWRIFDATRPAAQAAYVAWVRAQPAFFDLVLTVHSTHANHALRNKFRKDFGIDCVLFHPDQEADLHTDKATHVWMAVTDWTGHREIDTQMSGRLASARFTVLLDEDFVLEDNGLPIQVASRQIERVTHAIPIHTGININRARLDASLPANIALHYHAGGFVHAYIEP